MDMRNTTESFFCALLAAAVLLLAGAKPVLADIPPPTGYVETCTGKEYVAAGAECLACAGGRTTNRCRLLLAPYCYSNVCHTYGGTFFTEIWCRAQDPSAPAAPAEIMAQLMQFGTSTADTGDAAPTAYTCLPLPEPLPPPPVEAGTPASDASSTTDAASSTTGAAPGTPAPTEPTAGGACGIARPAMSDALAFLIAATVGLAIAAIRRRRR
jgi:hypothetical protein